MPFLRGSLSFERFYVNNFEAKLFDDSHLEILESRAASVQSVPQAEEPVVGFSGGAHLFDTEFDFAKNVIGDAVHAGIRIETNVIPSAIRNAWLQIELAGILKDSPDGKLTKTQRNDAKEAVAARCEQEIATGKYRKLSAFPWLWDLQREVLYFGGGGSPSGFCADLLEQAFMVEVKRMTAGSIAQTWAIDNDRYTELDDLLPASFVPNHTMSQLPWTNEHSPAPDYLGNEFLMWLWWQLETEGDTLSLPDGSDAVAMLTKTLSLECPLGESGKETISSEIPTRLPEAIQAVRSGKLPRKTGLSVVRNGLKFDLVLQAESFAISGAKISAEDDEPMETEDRIECIRSLCETVDLIYHSFLDLRTGDGWDASLGKISKWLQPTSKRSQKAA